MKLWSLLLVFLLANGESISQWIKKKKWPKNMSMSFKLADGVQPLFSAMAGRHFILILPTDSAWKQKPVKDLYEAMKKNTELAQELVLSAAVEVPRKVKKLSEVENDGLTTMSGVPVMLDKAKRKAYFGEYTSTGNVKKKGPAIELESQPVVVLDDVTIFAATKFHLPDDVAI